MNFPEMSESARLELLRPPAGRVRMVLDTDTYNEIDDQFAVVHALLSSEQMRVEAIYAAPFHNNRSSGPGDGMERSYEEVLRLLERLEVPPEGLVHRGAKEYLPGADRPVQSDAAADLAERAMASDADGPLYVAAIGAVTNVASALLLKPEIVSRVVVVWLGGHPPYWPHTREFNLRQDLHASRILFDSGVPLVQVPCMGVTSHLTTTVPELERYVQGRGAIGDYLVEIFKGYHRDHFAWSKVIWDISATAYLADSRWVPTSVVHSPILTDRETWSFDASRHFIRCATGVNRDAIFRDFFTKLEERTQG